MSMWRLVVGALLILMALNILFNLDLFRLILPLLLIWLGARIIWGKSGGGFQFERASEVNEEEIDEVLIFSGINKRYTSSKFKGGKLVVVFGGGEIDLREVKAVGKELMVEVVAIFGGIKVLVPESWRVRSEGVGIFGGYDNKARGGEGKTTLNVKGAAIFGGVEIVN